MANLRPQRGAPTSDDNLKRAAAEAAIHFVPEGSIIGVESGSTVNFFIAALARSQLRIKGAVAASDATAGLLIKAGIAIHDLNSIRQLSVYFDGADEINGNLEMIKGGGGSLTKEKIVAAVASSFVCMADESKMVAQLGRFPLPIETIPMASGHIARELENRGGLAIPRKGFVTENGNVILDIHGLRNFQSYRLRRGNQSNYGSRHLRNVWAATCLLSCPHNILKRTMRFECGSRIKR